MDNSRTETARDHDDSDLIDNAEPGTSHQGRSGGNLQTDISTQATLERVRDPEAHEGVDKDDDIAHGQRWPANRPADKTP